jgi:hypothetical protein
VVRRLLIANTALAVLLLAHIADHTVRQPASAQLPLSGSFPGLLGTLLVFVSLALVARDTTHAAQVAGLTGLATALGFVAVHLLPHWGMFSDPYAARQLDAGSWIEMLAALACGLLVAVEALRVCRSGPAPAARPRAPQRQPG